MNQLNIITYNCRGLPKSSDTLSYNPTVLSLLNKCDILCLQETFYSTQDIGSLNNLHHDFHGNGAATIDYRDKLYQGHPPGGVAILWRSKYDKYIKPIKFDNIDWVTGIEICFDNKSFILLCVYMPCMNNSNDREDEYVEKLSILVSIIEDLATSCIQICGDFNADCCNPNHKFGNILNSFLSDTGLHLSSELLLPNDSYTFISECWNTMSWLDHCISTDDGHNAILNMEIMYYESIGDHIPVKIDVSIDLFPSIENSVCENTHKLRWDNLKDDDICKYTMRTESHLSKVSFPTESVCCKDNNCKNKSHAYALSKMYDDIVDSLLRSSNETFPTIYNKKSNFKCRPGWSDYVKDMHNCARECFKLWCQGGKPKYGPLFKLMSTSRAKFKYSIRFIKRHINQIRADSLAKNMADNAKNFWNDVKKINNVRMTIPDTIDGVNGKEKIVDLWKNHFESIFNCLKSSYVFKCGGAAAADDVIQVTIEDISCAVNKLVNNKSCGLDGIYAEHLKYCSNRLLPLLSCCIQGLFVHGVLPSNMLSVVLVPIIKDKNGKINAKDNYRPIALASIMSKIVELLLLDRLGDALTTNCNQFGFKPKLGTDMCIYSLKEIVDCYRKLNGTIFMCFLDASKAFDRVNHSILFQKLRNRGVPMYVIRILMFWYEHQTMFVKWAGEMSEPFRVTNGVRQGGILSPYLFNVYMDGLSDKLNMSRYGCITSSRNVNHLMYADDLVLVAPSAKGMRELLHICELYGTEQDIKYNPKKSAILICRSLYTKNVSFAPFSIKGESINIVNKVKYLGHIITDDGMDDQDILRQCRQLYAQGNTLARNFFMCSDTVKINLFRTYFSSLYTSQLWWCYKDVTIKKLYVAYNNAFRMFMNLPKRCSASGMLAINNVSSCQAIIRNLVFKFMNRVDRSENVILQSVLSSDIRWQSRIRLHWMNLLYLNFDVP